MSALPVVQDIKDLRTDVNLKSSQISLNETNNNVTNISTELTNSRGGKVNLNARLIENESSLANNLTQVALKVDKVIGKGLSTNDYSATEKAEVAKVAIKADKAYTDLQIANVASGTPRTTYATLALLVAGIPTGNIYSYVCTDGHRYWWNGTAWTDGGIYQSVGVADRWITPIKTSFFNDILNYFNSATGLTDKDVDRNNGNYLTFVGRMASEFIPIEGNTTWLCNYSGNYAFCDVETAFISGGIITPNVAFTAPSNAKYVIISVAGLSNVPTAMLSKDALPTTYKPYGTTYINPNYIDAYALSQSEDFQIPMATSKFATLTWNSEGDSITANGLYQPLVQAKLGFALIRNTGIGGTYLASNADGSNTDAIVFRYLNMNNDADVITIGGGTNDWGANVPIGTVGTMDIKTIRGAVATIIEGLNTKYPGKYIIWLTLPKRNNGYTTTGVNANGDSTRDYAKAIIDVCESYATPCIDLEQLSGINKYNDTSYLGDGIHPIELGNKRIASLIIDMFNKVVY